MPGGSSQSSRSGWLELKKRFKTGLRGAVAGVGPPAWRTFLRDTPQLLAALSPPAPSASAYRTRARRTDPCRPQTSSVPPPGFLLTQRSIAAPPIQIFTQSACDAPLITRLIKRELRFAVHLPLKCAVCLIRNRSSPAVVRALAAGLTAGLRGRLGQPRAVWNWIELRQTCASDYPPPAHWLFPPKRQPSAPPKAREPPAQHGNPQA